MLWLMLVCVSTHPVLQLQGNHVAVWWIIYNGNVFITVYPTLDISDDEDFPVFKPRGKKKEDEAWNPKARVRVQGPRPERPMRQGVRRQAVEKGLEQAAARRQNLPVRAGIIIMCSSSVLIIPRNRQSSFDNVKQRECVRPHSPSLGRFWLTSYRRVGRGEVVAIDSPPSLYCCHCQPAPHWNPLPRRDPAFVCGAYSTASVSCGQNKHGIINIAVYSKQIIGKNLNSHYLIF